MRSAETYRAARRNRCLREEKGVWSSLWYYAGHTQQINKNRERKSKLRRVYEQAKSVLGIAPQATPQKPLRIRREGRGQ